MTAVQFPRIVKKETQPMSQVIGDELLLKDLSDEEFRARYQCDTFTATVLANRFRYIVKQMSSGLLTRAFSVILRDWYDFASTISGPPAYDYPMPAASDSLALFLGPMTDAVRNMVEEYGADNLEPGDVLICNDPYRIGTHVNDVCFVRPVFSQGRLVGFVNLQAHMLDMGGIVPGGFTVTKHNVYETGLVLGPILLYKRDQPVKSTWSLIFDNARFGGLLLPDIKTIYQNLCFGDWSGSEIPARSKNSFHIRHVSQCRYRPSRRNLRERHAARWSNLSLL